MADRKPQRHLDIFANGHSPEWPRDLIGPRQPALGPKPGWRFGNVVGVERYRSFIRRQDSRQAIHERALAGSIRADETDALALQQSEVNTGERGEAVEPFGNAGRLEDIGGHRRPRFQPRTMPTTPLGARVKKTTSKIPTMKRFAADEIVTVNICWAEPSKIAPMTGPHQVAVPPTKGMAMEFTAIARPKAVAG